MNNINAIHQNSLMQRHFPIYKSSAVDTSKRYTKKEIKNLTAEEIYVFKEAIKEDLEQFPKVNKAYLWTIFSAFFGPLFLKVIYESSKAKKTLNSITQSKNRYLRSYFWAPIFLSIWNCITQFFMIYTYFNSAVAGAEVGSIVSTYFIIAISAIFATGIVYSFYYCKFRTVRYWTLRKIR